MAFNSPLRTRHLHSPTFSPLSISPRANFQLPPSSLTPYTRSRDCSAPFFSDELCKLAAGSHLPRESRKLWARPSHAALSCTPRRPCVPGLRIRARPDRPHVAAALESRPPARCLPTFRSGLQDHILQIRFPGHRRRPLRTQRGKPTFFAFRGFWLCWRRVQFFSARKTPYGKPLGPLSPTNL